MNEVEIIQGARELLSNPKRWGKGSAYPTPRSYCVIGALSECNSSRRGSYERLKAVVQLVERHIPTAEKLVSFYNDDPETTHQDILNLLDKTLADLGGLG